MNLSTYRTIIVIIGLILVIIGVFLTFSQNELFGVHLCGMGLGFSFTCIISYLIKYYNE